MPKKQCKNSFYYFMIDYRENQKKKGINYRNMAEVAEAAGPLWKDAPPHIRAKFEEQAKKEKASKEKYTSSGISLSELYRQEKELQDAEEYERQDIMNIVKHKSFDGAIMNEDFYVMDVNCYCKAASHHLIAESTVLRFNLKDGIIDHYHEIINPGEIPVGYTHDAILGSQEIALQMPDETQKKSNYFQILANIIDYLKQKDKNAQSMPPIFTMPDKVIPVQDFFLQMCRSEAEVDRFRIYKLDTLFFMLMNAVKARGEDGFPRESIALAHLKQGQLKYTLKLGCEIHESADRTMECTTSRTKRWAFTVLESCCTAAGLPLLPDRHVARDYDLDTFLTPKDHKKERVWPSIAENQICAGRESFNDSLPTVENTKKVKRIHVPLRMPKTDYSLAIRSAPEVTEASFPSLTAGLGRGRGLAGIFKNMNISK